MENELELIDRVKLLKWIDLQDGFYSITVDEIIGHIKKMEVVNGHIKELQVEIEELEDRIRDLT